MASLLFAVGLASLSLTVVWSDEDWERYGGGGGGGGGGGVGGGGQSLEPLMVDAQDSVDPSVWLRYLISRQSVHPGSDLDAAPDAGGFSERRKRNNGAWVWMPAQGYVSLPKNQQAVDAGSSGKHGKIMRYGK